MILCAITLDIALCSSSRDRVIFSFTYSWMIPFGRYPEKFTNILIIREIGTEC